MVRMDETQAWVAGDALDDAVDRLIWGEPETLPGRVSGNVKRPKYSREPRAAIIATDFITQRPSRGTVSLTVTPYETRRKDQYWQCHIDDGEGHEGRGSGDTMPLAVCLAFLNLHESGDDTP